MSSLTRLVQCRHTLLELVGGGEPLLVNESPECVAVASAGSHQQPVHSHSQQSM